MRRGFYKNGVKLNVFGVILARRYWHLFVNKTVGIC